MKRLHFSLAVLAGLLFYVQAGLVMASGIDIERMSKEALKANLSDGSIVVVDVRTGRDWKSSEFKIKDAVRPEHDIAKWAVSQGYGKDVTLVLYCA